MGKSNRIRSKRENEKMKSFEVKKKKGMPGWAMTLITVIVALAIVFSMVAILFSANGVIGRWTNVVVSDNYKVNANMMSYYFMTQYQTFLSNYSAYLSTDTSAGMMSLNPSQPLKNQTFGGNPEDTESTFYDSMFLGEFEGTWYDYFMTSTVESVKSMLIYCEYAKENNITLTEEDYAEIDATMAEFDANAVAGGWPSTNEYFSNNIGAGVKKKDVRKCIEYSMLANKAIVAIADKLSASVTDAEIDEKYNGDKLGYNNVDYTYYSITIKYDEIAKEVLGKDYTEAELKEKEAQVLAAYKDAIKEAKEVANKLNAAANRDDFMKIIYTELATDEVESAYSGETIEDAIKPSDDDKAYFIAELIKDIVGEIEEGKEKADVAVEIPKTEEEVDEKTATIEVYGKTVKIAYANILNDIKTEAFEDVYISKDKYNIEKASYGGEDDDFSVWAFADGRAAGDKKIIAKYDGSDEKAEITNAQGQSITTVYYMDKAQYRDDTATKNFTYAVFGTKEEAEAAIKAIKEGELTVDAFKTAANNNAATAVESITDYQKGGMGLSAFDTWLFGDDVKAGSITATPISDASSGVYVIGIYEGEGKPNWYVDVKNVIVNEKAEAESEALTAKYPITVKERAYKKIKLIVN